MGEAMMNQVEAEMDMDQPPVAADPVTLELAAVRLHQLQTISQELLEWLGEMTPEQFEDLWEGNVCLPYEQFVKLEVLVDVAAAVSKQLRRKLKVCEVV